MLHRWFCLASARAPGSEQTYPPHCRRGPWSVLLRPPCSEPAQLSGSFGETCRVVWSG